MDDQHLGLTELKSKLISILSHELRSPLSAARWNTELILDGTCGNIQNAMAMGLVETVYKALSRLNNGLNSLIMALEVTENKTVIHETDIVLPSLVSSLLTSLKVEISSRHAQIVFDKDNFPPRIVADHRALKHILETLILNALHYGSSHPEVTIKGWVEKDFVFISVQDNGVGISQRNRELVFSGFFREERARLTKPEGLGLNLFISRALAEKSGGSLTLADGPGGANFVLKLPTQPIHGGVPVIR